MVHFLGVVRLVKEGGEFQEGKHQILAYQTGPTDEPNLKLYKTHVEQIVNKGASKLTAGKRIRLTSDNNDYDLHVSSTSLPGDDETIIVFFAVTETDFGKEHSIGKLFDEFKDAFYNACSASQVGKGSAGSCQKQAQNLLNQIIQKYSKSKLKEVQGKVDQVKDIMKDNVNKALDNVEKLEDMEQKSEQLEQQAKGFQQGAVQVKKRFRCEYYKATAILVALVVLIIIIIVIIVVETNKKKDG